MLLQDFNFNTTIALRNPPPTNLTEYIKPLDEKQSSKYYYPVDPKVQSFGLELAINNKDLDMLTYLWDDLRLIWDSAHLGYLINYLLDLGWQLGLNWLLGSTTSHILFNSLNAEDKANFLSTYIFSKKILPAELQQILS